MFPTLCNHMRVVIRMSLYLLLVQFLKKKELAFNDYQLRYFQKSSFVLMLFSVAYNMHLLTTLAGKVNQSNYLVRHIYLVRHFQILSTTRAIFLSQPNTFLHRCTTPLTVFKIVGLRCTTPIRTSFHMN